MRQAINTSVTVGIAHYVEDCFRLGKAYISEASGEPVFKHGPIITVRVHATGSAIGELTDYSALVPYTMRGSRRFFVSTYGHKNNLDVYIPLVLTMSRPSDMTTMSYPPRFGVNISLSPIIDDELIYGEIIYKDIIPPPEGSAPAARMAPRSINQRSTADAPGQTYEFKYDDGKSMVVDVGALKLFVNDNTEVTFHTVIMRMMAFSGSLVKVTIENKCVELTQDTIIAHFRDRYMKFWFVRRSGNLLDSRIFGVSEGFNTDGDQSPMRCVLASTKNWGSFDVKPRTKLQQRDLYSDRNRKYKFTSYTIRELLLGEN